MTQRFKSIHCISNCIDDVNAAIQVPEILRTDDGIAFKIVAWKPEVITGEVLQVNAVLMPGFELGDSGGD